MAGGSTHKNSSSNMWKEYLKMVSSCKQFEKSLLNIDYEDFWKADIWPIVFFVLISIYMYELTGTSQKYNPMATQK